MNSDLFFFIPGGIFQVREHSSKIDLLESKSIAFGLHFHHRWCALARDDSLDFVQAKEEISDFCRRRKLRFLGRTQKRPDKSPDRPGENITLSAQGK